MRVEDLKVGGRYKIGGGAFIGEFVKHDPETDGAYFKIDSPHPFWAEDDGTVGFDIESVADFEPENETE